MRRFIFRITLALMTAAALSVPAFSQNQAATDSLIARLWLERAWNILIRENLTTADLDAAASAIGTAGEFQPAGRDGLYLEALLLLRGYPSEDPIRQAYRLLGQSLDDQRPGDGNGDLVDFEERARLWASQALRLRDYRELLRRYRLWPGGHRDDPALLYAAGRAAVYLGLDREAAELARRGESLTENPRALESLGSAFRTGAQPAFRALAVAAGDQTAIKTLDAAWRRWGEDLTDAIIPWLLSGYIDFQDSPALAGHLPPDLQNSLLSLDTSEVMSRRPLPDQLKNDLAFIRRTSDTVRNEILRGYTGTLTADADYDGFDEEVLRMVNGSPDFRRVDSNQDGLFEWEIVYEGVNPQYIRFDEGRLNLTYEPESYPWLMSAVRGMKNLTVDVFFQPGGFQWSVSRDGDFIGPLLYPDWSDDDFWFGARMVNVTSGNPDEGNIVEARTYLSGGYPLRAVEREYPEGMPGRPLWIRELIYEDGIPFAGRRSFRADPEFPGRRIWELYERYENGRMVGLAWDPGMTGTPRYLRDWALGRYLDTQVWDLNADRWIDVRQFRLPDGSTDTAELLITQAVVDDLMAWTTSDWAPWDY